MMMNKFFQRTKRFTKILSIGKKNIKEVPKVDSYLIRSPNFTAKQFDSYNGDEIVDWLHFDLTDPTHTIAWTNHLKTLDVLVDGKVLRMAFSDWIVKNDVSKGLRVFTNDDFKKMFMKIEVKEDSSLS